MKQEPVPVFRGVPPMFGKGLVREFIDNSKSEALNVFVNDYALTGEGIKMNGQRSRIHG